MKTSILLVFTAIVALAPSEAQGRKIRFYGFAEQCLDADLMVIARLLRCKSNTILIEVDDYLVGSGPPELLVTFSLDRRLRAPDLIEGPRVVFVRQDDDGLRLFGTELQGIWPQTVPDGGRNPFAGLAEGVVAGLDRGVDFLVELSRKVRSCADSESQIVVTSALLDMFRSSDSFVRLAALQTCENLYGRDPEKYADIRRLGGAFALQTVGHPDGWIRNVSLAFMGAAPRSAALRSLVEAMSTAEVARGAHDAAFLQFRSLTGQPRWDKQFQLHANDPDFEVRTKVVGNMGEWLDENFVRIFAEDYEMIVLELSSKDVAMRAAGRIWLRTATGSKFGFDESGTRYQRAAALAKVRQWWEKLRD